MFNHIRFFRNIFIIFFLFLPVCYSYELDASNNNYIPSFSEIFSFIKDGADFGDIVIMWNPSVADRLIYEVLTIFESSGLTAFLNNIADILTLFAKYVFREPASLVSSTAAPLPEDYI